MLLETTIIKSNLALLHITNSLGVKYASIVVTLYANVLIVAVVAVFASIFTLSRELLYLFV